jgi:hypothetical protein
MVTRRDFLMGTGVALLGNRIGLAKPIDIRAFGPASRYVASIRAAFVRRKGEYGMRWPGQIYDGVAAEKKYRRDFIQAAGSLGIKFDLRSRPIYSLEEAEDWVSSATQTNPDGLMIILLDRQEHSWPTAGLAVESGIPTVIYSPVGTSFTTNTTPIAGKNNVFISCTDQISEPIFGMKMVKASAKLRETRFVVLRGRERREALVPKFGTKLRFVPAETFLKEYRQTPLSDQLKQLAKRYRDGATRLEGASLEDVENGVKSLLVARTILEREEGDAITMDCLGALGKSSVSLPCIAWSAMLDRGVPAACEADIGACLTHALVQYLFDRPGFQQDPVPETARNCLIGAHCTCPTRLNGFQKEAEPYHISFHHGRRDAVPVPQWRIGQRMTSADIILREEERPQMIISTGTVVENVSVPPAGGCVVSVMVELDDVVDYLSYPGFHQIFFYGDYRKELQNYCKLFDIEPLVV